MAMGTVVYGRMGQLAMPLAWAHGASLWSMIGAFMRGAFAASHLFGICIFEVLR